MRNETKTLFNCIQSTLLAFTAYARLFASSRLLHVHVGRFCVCGTRFARIYSVFFFPINTHAHRTEAIVCRDKQNAKHLK